MSLLSHLKLKTNKIFRGRDPFVSYRSRQIFVCILQAEHKRLRALHQVPHCYIFSITNTEILFVNFVCFLILIIPVRATISSITVIDWHFFGPTSRFPEDDTPGAETCRSAILVMNYTG
jgi:hypothetical protein